MIKRLVGYILFAALLSGNVFASDFLTPASLTSLSSISIYSIAQDANGAIWLNTSSGLHRFNGHTFSSPGPARGTYLSRLATADGRTFFLNHPDGLLRFSVSGPFLDSLETIAPALPENSPILAEGDSLLYSSYNKVYSYRDGNTSLLCSLPEGTYVRSFQRLPSGNLLAATYDSGIGFIIDRSFVPIMSLFSRTLATFLDEEGMLWIGTSNDGLFKVDTRDFSVVERIQSPEGSRFLDVRCFASDHSGNTYFGTASGLFRHNADNTIERLFIDGVGNNSICDVFVDCDGNLWVATFDKGVFYSNITSFPFTHFATDVIIGTPRSLFVSGDQSLWVASDPNGLLKYGDGMFSVIEPFEGQKIQSGFYDEVSTDIFLGNWDGMIQFDPGTRGYRPVYFADDISVGSRIPVFAIHRHGEDLYISSTIGAFLFNPSEESVISRRVEGINRRINIISETPAGDLFFAGDGLFRLSKGRTEYLEEYDGCFFLDFKQSPDGSFWGASYNDIINIGVDGRKTVYNRDSCGLPDAPVNYLLPLPDGRIVAGTALGITILDPSSSSCSNYGMENGLHIKSTLNSRALCLPDGTVLLGGNGALEKLDNDYLPDPVRSHNLIFDAITVNGSPLNHLPFVGRTLALDYDSSNISFDVANFDYTSVSRYVYYCKLDGVDDDWREFDISKPIECMNLTPGRYRFRVRESGNAGNARSEIAMPVRIMPVWYFSFPFIILWIIILSGAAFFVIYSIYSRNRLRSQLAEEEEQNVRQNRFFLDLSLKMRTPLNLMIGQIERYFKEYGPRARGVEDIQDVYGKATHIRSLISDFVDDSNGYQEEAPKYSKFLNAATGAVERNLFSGNLDVPFLCKELNMGKTKLTQLLKENSGMTPREFIEDIRLKHAAQMILDGNHTVAEVSDSLGFSNPKYFAVCFKKKYGCRPSEYGR